jgi:hypothetical protein
MRSISLLLLALFATAASAQQSIYVGLALGNFDFSEHIGDLVLGTVSDTATKQQLFGGFEINDHFAIEISYGKTDELHYANTVNVESLGEITGRVDQDFTITNLLAVGQLPFEWGALLGGIGFFSSDNDYRESYTGDILGGTISGDGSFSDDGMSAMLGAEWRFGRFGTRFGIRLQYEWWDIPDVDISSIGMAISYGF